MKELKEPDSSVYELPAQPVSTKQERTATKAAGIRGRKQPSLQQPKTVAHRKQVSRNELVATLEASCCEAAGVVDVKFAELMVNQMCAMEVWGRTQDPGERFRNALGALKELNPKNAIEALLAVQMFGTYNAAVVFLKRATREDQTFVGTDANVTRAVRLMRVFNEQLEAMAKLKGKTGQQKVTVEHVHVYSGGQAVVGMVEPSKTEERR